MFITNIVKVNIRQVDRNRLIKKLYFKIQNNIATNKNKNESNI